VLYKIPPEARARQRDPDLIGTHFGHFFIKAFARRSDNPSTGPRAEGEASPAKKSLKSLMSPPIT
ncbi:hypothetical protein, partial [Zobellella denitrificans]|uniref:hypothetical protein n=1 Tax=Zobellella denitrificans TaxID=347534 RepID=UPI001C3E6E23